VDSQQPTLLITERFNHTFENETLHKIGRSTGWTYGGVESTCDDHMSDAGVVVKCTDRVDYSRASGDSGAPVFTPLTDGTIELRGINLGHWCDVFGACDGVMSDLHQIELDLGYHGERKIPYAAA
jgi:hypothetical protein